MKPLYSLLAIVALAALSSCAALNTPVYHDGYSPPSTTEPQLETPAQPIEFNSPSLPTRHTPAVTTQESRQKRQLQRRDTHGFMLPKNTLGIPTKDDLKETATSTEQPSATPGLTVPAR